MPDLISSVRRFDRTNIPEDVWVTLRGRDNAARANVILPHAEKVSSHPEFLPGSEQFWLVYSEPTTSNIRFILSCTEGPLGTYPLFIIPVSPVELSLELLQGSMEVFCEALLKDVDFKRQRVFSVFSVEPIAEAFASAWEKIAEVKRINKPYYDAFFSICTPETFKVCDNPPSVDEVIELRLAVSQDAGKISELCEEFSNTSHPFTLSSERASEEARLLIENEQVWVCEIEKDGEIDIATIVAATRQSDTVAAITKVYTPNKWQRQGYAKRLVRRVCRELLMTHEQVVLYVGVSNSAQKLYQQVGFRAPCKETPEHWLEIGFDRDEVELGHW